MRFENNEEVVNFNGKTMITEKSNMIRLVDKEKKKLILFSQKTKFDFQ